MPTPFGSLRGVLLIFPVLLLLPITVNEPFVLAVNGTCLIILPLPMANQLH